MITEEETEQILQHSLNYILAVLEHNLTTCTFQLLHHLYETFKRYLQESLPPRIDEAKWEELAQTNKDCSDRISELQCQIESLNDALSDVEKLQNSV
jgi:hypothetical protein